MLQKRTLCIAFLAIISFTTSSAAACSANKVAVEAAVPLTCGKFNISKSTEPICVDIKSSAATIALLSFTGELDVTSANPNEKARGGRAFIAEILKTQDTNCVNLNEYGTALAMIMIPAALFWFLNGLCCCCCTCCHSCCKICSGCKSCKCIPRTEKMYTTCERNFPVLFMLLFCLLFMVFAGVGIAKGMFEFNDSLVGGVCQIDNWYIGVKDFNAKLKTPLETLRIDFDLAVKDLKEAAVIDPALQENVDAIAPLFGLIAEKATDAAAAAAAGTEKVWVVTLPAETTIVAAEGSPVTQVGGATGTLAKVKVTGQDYSEFSVISNGNFAATGQITIGAGCTDGCTHAAVAVGDATTKTKETCEGLFEDITTQMNSAKAASIGQAEDLAKTLTDTQTMINDNIIVMAGPADEKIVLITKALDDFDRQVEAILNPKNFVGVDLFTYAEIVQKQRSSSAFAAFGIWFIAAMLAVIGVIGMKFMHQEKFLEVGEKRNLELTGDVIALSCMGRCFSRVTCCSWWLVLFFGISSGFFALMFLPIAAVGRDICQVLPTLPQDIGQMFDNADITKLTNSVSLRLLLLFLIRKQNHMLNTFFCIFFFLHVSSAGILPVISLMVSMEEMPLIPALFHLVILLKSLVIIILRLIPQV